MAKKTVSNKKRVVKVDAYGEAHISSTFNNVIVTLTNSLGQVISWSSAGKVPRNDGLYQRGGKGRQGDRT